MIVSTKGRYALRVMVDLAEHNETGFIPMKQVAQRQGISLKYLERILPMLTKSHFVEGVKGKGGGYKLTRSPKDYKVGEVLRLVEGNLAPVTCLENNAKKCSRVETCRTVMMWGKLNSLINDYLDNVTIQDLMQDNSCVCE